MEALRKLETVWLVTCYYTDRGVGVSGRVCMDDIKGGRKYVVIKRLFMERKNSKPTNLWVEDLGEKKIPG